jgi:glycosyltransferase involved in cell wall biosynthesis
MQQPHILHLVYSNKGGAGLTAYRFHQLLQQAGCTSQMLVLKKDPDIADELVVQLPLTLWQRGIKKVKEIAQRLQLKAKGNTINPAYSFYGGTEQITFFSTRQLMKQVHTKPDIILLHWLSGFVNAKNIYELSTHYNAPVIWRFNDMSPFTGGCHYTFTCTNYESGCGHCPALASHKAQDLSSKNIQYKIDYYTRFPLLFIASTTEINEELSKSTVGRATKIRKIFPAISTTHFTFKPMQQARQHFGLPADKKVILFAAKTFYEQRKGFDEIIQVLHHFKTIAPATLLSNIELVFVSSDSTLPPGNLLLPVKKYNSLPPDELFLLYQAADVFISASVQDGGPMTLCEAILAGTPAVAYNIGIAKDIIQDNITGYRVPLRQHTAMATALLQLLLLSPAESLELREKTRFFAKDFFDPGREITAYNKLFNQILNREQ